MHHSTCCHNEETEFNDIMEFIDPVYNYGYCKPGGVTHWECVVSVEDEKKN